MLTAEEGEGEEAPKKGKTKRNLSMGMAALFLIAQLAGAGFLSLPKAMAIICFIAADSSHTREMFFFLIHSFDGTIFSVFSGYIPRFIHPSAHLFVHSAKL